VKLLDAEDKQALATVGIAAALAVSIVGIAAVTLGVAVRLFLALSGI
jgi:hypothetical protein